MEQQAMDLLTLVVRGVCLIVLVTGALLLAQAALDFHHRGIERVRAYNRRQAAERAQSMQRHPSRTGRAAA